MATSNDAPQIVFYTRIRKSPYFEASRRQGVKAYSVYNHMYHPRYYGDPVEEYWKLLTDVTLWDVGVERQVEITGPDAFDFINLLTPRDLTKCAVGQCKYAIITAEDGGIVNDPVLLRLDNNHFWLSVADSDVLLWAKGVAFNSGLNVHIQEPDVGPVQLQGPKSRQVMQDLFGDRVLDLPYYHLFTAKLDDMNVVVSRTGYTGEVGYEIYLHNASRHALKLWDTVLEAGRPYNISVVGPSHIRRLEAGILAYGADMTLENNPYEIGLGRMVGLDQEADFIGKEALRVIKARGVQRKLVGVEIHGDPLGTYVDGSMEDFWPVIRDGTQIGHITSACRSPRLEKNIGYAMLPIKQGDLGTELTVQTPAGKTTATVIKKPFIDPKKEIPKA